MGELNSFNRSPEFVGRRPIRMREERESWGKRKGSCYLLGGIVDLGLGLGVETVELGRVGLEVKLIEF